MSKEMRDKQLEGLMTAVLALREGDEIEIDGWVYFRIDADEIKVHPAGEPDGLGSSFIPRSDREMLRDELRAHRGWGGREEAIGEACDLYRAGDIESAQRLIRGLKVSFEGNGRTYLGDVDHIRKDKNGWLRLAVKHFNGEPWDTEPYWNEVNVI